jgi:hypothetical protein
MTNMGRVIEAAVQAALGGQASDSQSGKSSDEQKRRGLSTPRAFLIGAGVLTVGRLAVGSRGRDMLENLQERVSDYEGRRFEHRDDGEPEEAQEGEDFDDEEPEAEEEEDFDDEYEQEPEDEEDEHFDDEDQEEPEAEEDEDFDEDRPRRRRTRHNPRARSRA